MKLLSSLALLLTLATGCSPVGLLNVLVPGDTFERHADVAYGEGDRRRLDVYVPREAAAQPRPVVVFFYGGSWKGGSRESYLFVAEALAARGFVVVIPDYRVFPEVRYPGFVEDAASAFAWTHREIARYRGDPGKIFVMGHSAGAQIATMLAYNPRFLANQGLDRSSIRGVIGLAGPYDFVPTAPDIRTILSGEGDVEAAMPARFVRGGEPRSLLITGDGDTTVSPGNQERLARRLREAGSPVEERRFASLNHYTLIGRFAAPFRNVELLEAIAAFVRG